MTESYRLHENELRDLSDAQKSYQFSYLVNDLLSANRKKHGFNIISCRVKTEGHEVITPTNTTGICR